MAQTQLMNKQSVANIMNKRTPVSEQHVGKKVVLEVQGSGTTIDVTDKDGAMVVSKTTGDILRKTIFNCKATSGIAMKNERNIQLYVDACAAEKAGDAQGAHELFRAFLNATQLSFSVLLPSGAADKLANGVDFAGKIQRIDTDNGSLLTVDQSSIAVREPEVITDSVNFDMSAYLPKEDTKEDTKAKSRA